MPDVPPRRPPGHPSFEPTNEQRNLVQVMRANGDTLAIIARSIGCDEKTLRKHFKSELADGHARVVAAVRRIGREGRVGRQHLRSQVLAEHTHGGPEWKVIEGRQIGGLEGAPPIAISDAKVTIFIRPGRPRPLNGSVVE